MSFELFPDNPADDDVVVFNGAQFKRLCRVIEQLASPSIALPLRGEIHEARLSLWADIPATTSQRWLHLTGHTGCGGGIYTGLLLASAAAGPINVNSDLTSSAFGGDVGDVVYLLNSAEVDQATHILDPSRYPNRFLCTYYGITSTDKKPVYRFECQGQFANCSPPTP